MTGFSGWFETWIGMASGIIWTIFAVFGSLFTNDIGQLVIIKSRSFLGIFYQLF